MSDDDDIRRAMLDLFGLRVQPHMAKYVQRQLIRGGDEAIPVMGGDARTGVAVRRVIAMRALQQVGGGGTDRAAAATRST